MDKIQITLETLYDSLRNEKKKEDLQKVKDSFFTDVVSYLKEKKALFESRKEQEELFASGEREKLSYELRSIQRILKELYDKREKKVIAIAINRSRTNSDLIDTSAMLLEERQFYQELVDTLNKYRRGILFRLWRAEAPDVPPEASFASALLSSPLPKKYDPYLEQTESADDEAPITKEPQLTLAEQTRPAEAAEEPAATLATPAEEKTQPEERKEEAVVRIRFVQPTPSFIWKNLQVYGPFDPGEETRIFPEVADLLVRKGRAEMLEHAPENCTP